MVELSGEVSLPAASKVYPPTLGLLRRRLPDRHRPPAVMGVREADVKRALHVLRVEPQGEDGVGRHLPLKAPREADEAAGAIAVRGLGGPCAAVVDLPQQQKRHRRLALGNVRSQEVRVGAHPVAELRIRLCHLHPAPQGTRGILLRLLHAPPPRCDVDAMNGRPAPTDEEPLPASHPSAERRLPFTGSRQVAHHLCHRPNAAGQRHAGGVGEGFPDTALEQLGEFLSSCT